jgi:hypothetical protein
VSLRVKEGFVSGRPGINPLERSGIQAVEHSSPVSARAHQASPSQNVQMLRNRRLRHAKAPVEFVYRVLALEEQVEQCPPRRIGHGPKDSDLLLHCAIHGAILISVCLYVKLVPEIYSPISCFQKDPKQQTKEESSMSETSTLIGYSGRTIGREELARVPTHRRLKRTARSPITKLWGL